MKLPFKKEAQPSNCFLRELHFSKKQFFCYFLAPFAIYLMHDEHNLVACYFLNSSRRSWHPASPGFKTTLDSGCVSKSDFIALGLR